MFQLSKYCVNYPVLTAHEGNFGNFWLEGEAREMSHQKHEAAVMLSSYNSMEIVPTLLVQKEAAMAENIRRAV